ncbi:MAG TPA: hypothetical protein VJN92_24245 [Candidatus Acidoferrum sp.]|nr:hypothetical protein [Candidatus Acidoferrum sp.]
MPVSLARGTITTDFDLNIHAFYSIDISLSQGGNLICANGAGLRTRRISSIGKLPVYRYQWVEDKSRAIGRDTIAGSFLGGFEGRRGHYKLQIEVLSDTGCLDVDNPRLYILASNADFIRWNRYYQNASWISFVSGSIGFGLLIVGIRERLRSRSTKDCGLSFFEPRCTDSYAARQRERATPWIPFFSQVGLLYSQILLLLGIWGVLIFHYALGYHRSHGLFVLTYFPESSFFKHIPCAQAWVVRVESSKAWYLNSARIGPDDLPDTLRAQIGTRTSCIVFFDAEPEVPYADAIRAIDLIEQSTDRVVLLTPHTKRVHIPK